MAAVVAPRMPVATGRPGAVDAGLGLAPDLSHDRPVAWFRGAATAEGTEVMARTVHAGTDAGLPVVGVLSGVGVPLRASLDALDGWGRVAAALAAASGQVPTVLVVDGPCLGSQALLLGLADIVVMTAAARAYVNDPGAASRLTGAGPLAAESLGGPWVHATRSGLADLVGDDLDTALDLVADVLALLPANNNEPPPAAMSLDPVERPTARAAAAVPTDTRVSYDVRDVITDVADGDSFIELRSRFGPSVVTGLGRVAGMPIGVVANQPAQLAGALDIDGSTKGARFVRFCDALNLPVVTFVDTPGFRPGRDQEWRGMIRHGAKLAFAYAEATVPRVSVVLRKAYGGAFIVMDCKSMGNDCALAWPTAEIAVMGAKGAVEILHRRELDALPVGAAREHRRLELESTYEGTHLTPTSVLERGFVDAVIDPAETRGAVAGALAALAAKRERLRARRHDNIPL
jgi:acetyl-CoA carboxylase carboxyltransferase component